MSRSVSSRSSLRRAPMRATSASTSSRTIRCMSRSAASGPSREVEDVEEPPSRGSRSAPSAARASRSGRAASSAARRRAVQLQEALNPRPRLRRHLRRLERRAQRGDHVELAPPGDLDHAREIDLAQLDRRARQRAHDRRGVARIGQQPRPGDHVAHLRALHVHGGLGRHLRRRARLRIHGRLGRRGQILI